MCSESRLTLTLEGGADGGIIFIQGYGSACRQNTVRNTTVFEFIFSACGIDPYESFSVIVQKRPHYQSGNDLSYQVVCLFDLSIELSGSNLNFESVDEEGVNITIRPTASMTFFSNGQEVTTGQVDLTDTLTMSIQLGSEFKASFDVKARYCTANTIEIITDFCSTDTELFPNFLHPAQGLLASTFNAFRTTDLNGGIVNMVFSCTLQLCFGVCSQTNCSNGDVVYGKRKRRAENKHHMDDPLIIMRNKRSTEDDDDRSLNVGALISVSDTIGVGEKDGENILTCINIVILIIWGTILGFTLIACPVYVTSLTRKMAQGRTKKEQPIPNVTKLDTFVCTHVPNSRAGTTTRRFSGQFTPVKG
ncbi:uncharacterized protein [Argopecten irradians]|uniref:uncharacterized protein n=1 Tax=Argopecten irradians TaxID=31199 RepID=UPI00371F181C